jgi:hypothetical protein
MQGWTSAEILINYALLVKEFKPDIVIVHEAFNDAWPRMYRHMEPDYSHFRNNYADCLVSGPPPDFGLLQSFRLYMFVRCQLAPLHSQRDFRKLLIAPDKPGNPFYNPWEGKIFKDLYLNPRTDILARNINTIIDLIQADGATPVLMTQPFSHRSSEFMPAELTKEAASSANGELRRIAEKRNVFLIDLDHLLTGKEHLFGDFIHLNNTEGRQIKAELIFQALKEAGIVCSGARKSEPR